MKIEDIARVAHEINRAYCQSLDDDSQPEWKDAPDWQKDSAVQGVKFHLENPDAGPEASHNSWMKQKLDDGWQWGPKKNPDIKEHPCIENFEFLPQSQQAKDYLFRQVVHSLVPLIEESPKEMVLNSLIEIVKDHNSVNSDRLKAAGLLLEYYRWDVN